MTKPEPFLLQPAGKDMGRKSAAYTFRQTDSLTPTGGNMGMLYPSRRMQYRCFWR